MGEGESEPMTNKIAYMDGEIGEVTAAGRSKNRGSKKNPGFYSLTTLSVCLVEQP